MQKEKIVSKGNKRVAVNYPVIMVDSQAKRIVILSEEGKATRLLSEIPWATAVTINGVTLKKRRLIPQAVIEFKKGLNIHLDGRFFDGYQVPIPG